MDTGVPVYLTHHFEYASDTYQRQAVVINYFVCEARLAVSSRAKMVWTTAA